MSPQIVELLSRHGLAAVFAGTVVEGETVLLAAGALAQQGLLSPLAVWISGAAGAWCGHLAGFAAGRWLGRRGWPSRSPWLSERLGAMGHVVRAHPRSAIFLLQYLYGVRLAGALALGATRLPWPLFALYEALNCLVWSALVTTLGAGLGRGAASLMQGWLGWGWLALSVLVLALLVHRLARGAARRWVRP